MGGLEEEQVTFSYSMERALGVATAACGMEEDTLLSAKTRSPGICVVSSQYTSDDTRARCRHRCSLKSREGL